ncbi:MAG: hypothetical protein AAF772_00360 [Acidobacteriota bacterium]
MTTTPIIDDLAEVEELQIEPLTDQELDAVAGRWSELSTADSCICCVDGATSSQPESKE